MQKWALKFARKIHELKTWPAEYQAVLDGKKLYEVRKNDRDYRVKDVLYLREWDPKSGEYTGRGMHVVVTHITNLGQWIVAADSWVVLGIM